MTEKEMEDLIAAYPDDFFFQHQLVLRGRQQSLAGVGRFDLLFEDRFRSQILMELKAHALNYENASQVAEYRDELRRLGHGNVVMWLVAPQIPHSVREFLDDKGIQYTEINVAEFRRVAERHEFAILPADAAAAARVRRGSATNGARSVRNTFPAWPREGLCHYASGVFCSLRNSLFSLESTARPASGLRGGRNGRRHAPGAAEGHRPAE